MTNGFEQEQLRLFYIAHKTMNLTFSKIKAKIWPKLTAYSTTGLGTWALLLYYDQHPERLTLLACSYGNLVSVTPGWKELLPCSSLMKFRSK